jgi:hypothetical protein
VAIEVPLKKEYVPAGVVLRILSPGAVLYAPDPKLEKVDS